VARIGFGSQNYIRDEQEPGSWHCGSHLVPWHMRDCCAEGTTEGAKEVGRTFIALIRNDSAEPVLVGW
jgi:hypothetical protein